MKLKKTLINERLTYNLRTYGAPKLVNAESLDESRFRYTTDNIISTAVSYFKKDPDVWEFPAKNYFVRICIAHALAGDEKEFYELLDDNSILPYDDRYSKPYSEAKGIYDAIIGSVEDMGATPGYRKTMEIFGYLYEHPLRGKKLTIGYNLTGQEFFDTISFKKKYIEEFYFSFCHTMPKQPLDPEEVFRGLTESCQYGIPANLLLNTEEECENCKELIEKALLCCEKLHAVSVLDYDTAKRIKEDYPWIRVHISTHGAQTLKVSELDPAIIFCVNLNEPTVYGQHQQDIIKACRERHIKIKYIVNRGCVCNKHDMMTKLSGRYIMCCQKYQCKQLRKDFPWIDLCRTNLTKEMLVYWHPDYIKLSTREMDNKTMHHMLEFWTSAEPTKKLSRIRIPEAKYDIFMEWIRTRCLECDGECWKCDKCKGFYERLTEDDNA